MKNIQKIDTKLFALDVKGFFFLSKYSIFHIYKKNEKGEQK